MRAMPIATTTETLTNKVIGNATSGCQCEKRNSVPRIVHPHYLSIGVIEIRPRINLQTLVWRIESFVSQPSLAPAKIYLKLSCTYQSWTCMWLGYVLMTWASFQLKRNCIPGQTCVTVRHCSLGTGLVKLEACMGFR